MSKKLVRVITLVLCSFLLATTFFVATGGRALALSGDQYNGTWPDQTGCADSAGTEFSLTGSGWTLNLRYSSSCQTNWARFFSIGGALSCWQEKVERQEATLGVFPAPTTIYYPAVSYYRDGCGLTPNGGATSVWTLQLYGYHIPVRAGVRFRGILDQWSDNWTYTDWDW